MIIRFHCGKPKNPCEWHCYAPGYHITRKGEAAPDEPPPMRLIQRMDLRWWFGISGYRRAAWFFGVLRWEEKKP